MQLKSKKKNQKKFFFIKSQHIPKKKKKNEISRYIFKINEEEEKNIYKYDFLKFHSCFIESQIYQKFKFRDENIFKKEGIIFFNYKKLKLK